MGATVRLFVRVLAEGSTDLKPETSTNTNLGVVWSPSDNFDFRVDYWKFDYEDVITVQNAQGLLTADPNGPNVSRVNGVLNGMKVAYIQCGDRLIQTDSMWPLIGICQPVTWATLGFSFR